MTRAMTREQLDEETVVLLPDRETLWTISVMATNSSMALNAATAGSTAFSGAFQTVMVGM
jgi:hypothetical protein